MAGKDAPTEKQDKRLLSRVKRGMTKVLKRDSSSVIAELRQEIERLEQENREIREQARVDSIDVFKRAISADSRSDLETLSNMLSELKEDKRIPGFLADNVLKPITRSIRLKKAWPKVKARIDSYKDDIADHKQALSGLREKLRTANLDKQKYKQEAEALLEKVKQYQTSEELQKIIFNVLSMCKTNPRFLEAYAGEAEAARVLAQANDESSESREDFMFFELIGIALQNAKDFEEKQAGAILKAHDREDAANARLNALLDSLEEIAPDQVKAIRNRIKQSDELKELINKGEKPEQERESYADIFQSVIPGTLVRRQIIQDLYDSFVNIFPDKSGKIKTLLEQENNSENDDSIVQAVIGVLKEQAEQIAKYQKSSKDSKDYFSRLVRDVLGTKPDEKRLAEDPVGYAAEAVEELKQRLASAAQYASAPSDPVVFVKQAYVHQMLGNAYAAEGQEALAKIQYDKAKALCDSALYSATDADRSTVELELAKLKKFTEDTEDE